MANLFWPVFDLDMMEIIEVHDDKYDAINAAQGFAEDRIGSTIVVLEPAEAFVATAVVSKAWLSYPTKAEDPPPPPTPDEPFIARDVPGKPTDEDGDPIL